MSNITDKWDAKAEAGYQRNDRTKNKSWYVRFLGYLNNVFNSHHDWIDYDSQPDSAIKSLFSSSGGFRNWLSDVGGALGDVMKSVTQPDTLSSLVNTWTGAHLTGSQREANEMQMQNVEDVYQRQVTGMQSAGLNPALMYQGGASASAPTVQGSQGTANMSELMQALLLDRQAKLLDSQTKKTDAETDKIGAETEQIQLINKYYPQVTEANLKKVFSELGVNDAKVKEMLSQVDLNKLDADLKEIQKIINKAQADESSAYFKASRQLAEAQTEEAKARARAEQAKAFMDELEGKFMDKFGAKMGSSEWIALASAISSVFGVDLSVFGTSPFAGVFKMLRDSLNHSYDGKGGNTSPTGGGNDNAGGGGR